MRQDFQTTPIYQLMHFGFWY